MPLILDNEPGVQFEELAGMFITVFGRSTAKADEMLAKEVHEITTEETTNKTTAKTTIEKSSTLSMQEKSILSIIEETPIISQREIAALIGLSVDGVRYHTDKLKKKGVLRRIGGTKGGRWEIML